jgi:hypothetical protein
MVMNNNTDTVLVDKPPTEFLPEQPHPSKAIHNLYELKVQPELVRYLHAAAGYPTKPTWIEAIKNKQFASRPGLTVKAVAKNFPESKETIKGHARKIKSGFRSTKQKEPANEFEDEEKEVTTHPIRPTIKQNDIFIKIYDVEEDATGLIYSDQTGCFPKKSSQGNQYIMVLAHIDSNAILAEPMKNRIAGEMIRAYQALLDRLQTAGVMPKRHILDNKYSEEFKATIRKNKMTFQLVPPHDHWRNITEKAIQTFKVHFISILCGTDITFPLHLWCRLLRQSEHALNMLRRARITPMVSVYAYLWGQHDYNANPFAPLGCNVEAHVTPEVRETWAPHTMSGYYIGNAEEHYRCHKIYISDTKSECICKTVFFKHKYLTMPMITPAEAILKAADNLVDAICNQIPKNMPQWTPWNNLWKYLRSKPRKQHAKQQLKGCLGNEHSLKGWTQRHKQQ